jgi:hypothetical protein
MTQFPWRLAGEASAGPEIDLDIEPLFLGFKVDRGHHRGGTSSRARWDEIDIAHGLSALPFAPFAAIDNQFLTGS